MLNSKSKDLEIYCPEDDTSEFEKMASPLSDRSLEIGETGLVYIVDDEPEILDILVQTLEGAGITVVGFTSPGKMLEAFHRRTPDLVITDMRMDGLDGINILQAVKRVSVDVPVVIVSGHLDTPNLLESIDEGAFGALQKPFEMERVLEMSVSAIRQCQTKRHFGRSLNLILYHFADVKEYLTSQGRGDLVFSLESELRFMLEQRRTIRASKR